MGLKSTTPPEFAGYTRRDYNYEKIDGKGINYLSVPGFLIDSTHTPFVLMESVNGFCLCDLVGDDLVIKERETAEIRKKLIQRSPRIMRTSKEKELYVKEPGLDCLSYSPFSGDSPITLLSDFDYIVTKSAAILYTKEVGICTKAQFDLAEEEGKLNFFLSVGFSHVGGGLFRRDLRVYLVDEIHRLSD